MTQSKPETRILNGTGSKNYNCRCVYNFFLIFCGCVYILFYFNFFLYQIKSDDSGQRATQQAFNFRSPSILSTETAAAALLHPCWIWHNVLNVVLDSGIWTLPSRRRKGGSGHTFGKRGHGTKVSKVPISVGSPKIWIIFSLPFCLCIFAWVQKAFADYLRIKERQRALCFCFFFFFVKWKNQIRGSPLQSILWG